jgi:hypothetical protein
MLAAAVLATAQTFGLSPGPAPQACMTIANASYQLVSGRGDIRLHMSAATESSDIVIGLAATPDEADFVFVDDGAPPTCGARAGVRRVSIGETAPDLTVAVTSEEASAHYRIYVRSASVTPEAAAAVFAASRSAELRQSVTGSIKLTRSR